MFGASIVLTIVFVILKVQEVIDWGWVVVVSPLWICFLLWLLATMIGFLWFVVNYKNMPKRLDRGDKHRIYTSRFKETKRKRK